MYGSHGTADLLVGSGNLKFHLGGQEIALLSKYANNIKQVQQQQLVMHKWRTLL